MFRSDRVRIRRIVYSRQTRFNLRTRHCTVHTLIGYGRMPIFSSSFFPFLPRTWQERNAVSGRDLSLPGNDTFSQR